MNKEVFISLLKLNSIKIDNDILSVTKRHTNYEVPDAEVINTKQELPIIDFGNQSMKVILDRIYKMDGSEMEDLTDDIDAKNEFVRELSKKNKTELVKHIYQRTERTISNSNLQKPKLFRVAKYLGYLTIKIQSEEGLKSENIDEETESYDNMRQKKKRYFGSGLKDDRKFETGKFYIDLGKLHNNILNVKYTSCRGSVPNIKAERISDDVKDVILDIIGNKYNSKLFDKLFTDDQRIIANLIKTLRIPDINMDVFNKRYQHEYEILLRQVNSGNTNEKVKMQLKKYILRGI